MTYVQWATGFKGGGISPRPFSVAQAVPFDPEELESYELGVRSDMFDRRLRINASVFFSLHDDVQLTLASCPQFGMRPAYVPETKWSPGFQPGGSGSMRCSFRRIRIACAWCKLRASRSTQGDCTWAKAWTERRKARKSPPRAWKKNAPRSARRKSSGSPAALNPP